MRSLLEELAIGDRRTTGRSAQVADAVLRDPKLFDIVFEAMWQSDDAGVRMRASNVCETVTRTRPDLLQARKKELLKDVAQVQQQEVRWHYCQMLPRVKLTRAERRRAFEQLKTFLGDKSGIVKTFAMQAMYDLAMQDDTLLEETRAVIDEVLVTGTPAMKSRGRKLAQGMGRSRASRGIG